MTNERAKVIDLAARVADGEAIDWEREAAADPEQSGTVRNLRLLQQLSETLRERGDESHAELVSSLRTTVDEWFQGNPVRPAAPLGAKWGSLRLAGMQGSGAFADVYRAHDPALQRNVALKIYRDVSPTRERQLLEEGRKLARVRHPNVVTVHGAAQHEGRTGLWMEFVEGRTLEERVEGGDRMAEEEAATVGRTLCGAVAAVHRAGVLHRDIKAGNVIRAADGRLVLVDLGSGVDRSAAADGRFTGTPLYLAPEMLDGCAASRSSDVYSLGVLLFYLVTGAHPFSAANLSELREAHRLDRRRHLRDLRPELSERFVKAVERATDPDPTRRFTSAGAFAAALAGDKAAPSLWRRRSLAASGLGLLVAAVVVAVSSILFKPAAPGIGFQVDARLYRVTGGERVALEPGDAVGLGDLLRLDFTASEPLHVYVFNEDSRGRGYRLFPLPGPPLSNPLPADLTVTLPSNEVAWQVDSMGGTERVHVVASRDARLRFEELLDALPPAGADNPLFGRRGMGSLRAVDVPAAAPVRPLVQAARSASDTAERVSGTWYWTISLEGPSP